MADLRQNSDSVIEVHVILSDEGVISCLCDQDRSKPNDTHEEACMVAMGKADVEEGAAEKAGKLEPQDALDSWDTLALLDSMGSREGPREQEVKARRDWALRQWQYEHQLGRMVFYV